MKLKKICSVLGAFGLAFSLLAVSTAVQASPLPQNIAPYIFGAKGEKLADALANSSQANWKLISENEAGSLTGVAKIVFAEFNTASFLNQRRKGADLYDSLKKSISTALCSGAILKPERVVPESPVYLLTAGHCVLGSINAKLSDGPFGEIDLAGGEAVFKLTHDHAKTNSSIHIPLKRWVYAAPAPHDIGIIELQLQWKDLAALGLRSYSIQTTPLKPGDRLLMAGHPAESIKVDRLFLHSGECNFTGFDSQVIPVSAGAKSIDTVYYEGALLHNCSLTQGASGSPFFDRTGKIAGIASTVSTYQRVQLMMGGEERLIQAFKDYNRAGDPASAAKCFDARGVFTLGKAGCGLEKPCTGDAAAKLACETDKCETQLGGAACFNLGLNFVTNKQTAAAVPFFLKGCERNEARSCVLAGIVQQENAKAHTAKADAKAALAAWVEAGKSFLKACDLNLGDGCFFAGEMERTSPAGKASKPIFVKLYKKACAGASADGCHTLGHIFSDGKVLSKDPDQAILAFARACISRSPYSNADTDSCRHLATMHEQGLGASQSKMEIGALIFAFSCLNKGDKASCVEMGKRRKILEAAGATIPATP